MSNIQLGDAVPAFEPASTVLQSMRDFDISASERRRVKAAQYEDLTGQTPTREGDCL